MVVQSRSIPAKQGKINPQQGKEREGQNAQTGRDNKGQKATPARLQPNQQNPKGNENKGR